MSHSSTMPVLDRRPVPRGPQFREAACQHGLRHGWTQSLHDLQHNESQISVARPAEKIDIVEADKAGSVQWLCHTLHAVLGEHHLNALCPPQPK
jgi:LuxR family transcriptional regulator